MDKLNLAVIGAGSVGFSLTAVAPQLGARGALIERSRMGGDCLNVGCVPSKALLAALHAARVARTLLGTGIMASAAGEMIGLSGLAIRRKAPLSALVNMVLPYPTRAEAGKRSAGTLFIDRLSATRTWLLVRALLAIS